MGHVDAHVTGCTELRVHGVSGTPPEGMLCHPHVQRVAGDGTAGFHRRVWESERCSEDGPEHRLEAYSWGGLTSGSWKRALWLLLLPFMLVNVAYYMTPRRPTHGDAWARLRWGGEAVQRLLALSLTLTLVLAAVTVSMDVVGWQCGRDGAACTTDRWLAFLDWPWLAEPSRRLVVTALLPVAVVALLWRLAAATWAVAERVPAPGTPTPRDPARSPLEDASFWNGRTPVRRLRALHVAAALALVGLFLAVPLLPEPEGGPGVLLGAGAWSRGAGAALVTAFLLALLVCVVAMLQPGLTDRHDPEDDTPDRVWEPPLPWVCAALVAAAALVLWLAPAGVVAGGVVAGVGTRPAMLPWLDATVLGLVVVQAGLVLLLLGVRGLQAWSSRAAEEPPRPAAGSGGRPVSARRAWWGLATVVLVVVAWLLAGGFAAALTLRVADAVGTPVAATAGAAVGPQTVLLPVQYFWAAVAALGVVVVALGAGVWSAVRLRGERRRVREQLVEHAYPVLRELAQRRAGGQRRVAEQEVEERAEAIARVWAAASVSEVARRAVGRWVLAAAVLVAAGVAGFVADRTWLVDSAPRWVVTGGGLVMTAAVLGLLWVGRQAYANPAFRRTVGILWDLGTFWPRATHPLAPPCYAERTIPDLVRRIEHLHAGGGTVVLSCHSQGTVIGAAALAQLTPEARRDVAFLTYGSPLRRLYARFFPVYFGLQPLLRLGDLLAAPPGPAGGGTADVPPPRRPEDPVPVAAAVGEQPLATGEPAGAAAPTPAPAHAPAHAPDTAPAPDTATVPSTPAVPEPPPDEAEARERWPWLNLYRPSDPIGGPVFVDYPAVERPPGAPAFEAPVVAAGGDPLTAVRALRAEREPGTWENGDVDWQLVDPLFDRPGGDGCWPPTRGHSDYFADAAFDAALWLVEQRRRAAR